MGDVCRCLIHHWTTEDERKDLVDNLEYFREIGDTQGITITLAQLTQPCPAREGESDG